MSDLFEIDYNYKKNCKIFFKNILTSKRKQKNHSTYLESPSSKLDFRIRRPVCEVQNENNTGNWKVSRVSDLRTWVLASPPWYPCGCNTCKGGVSVFPLFPRLQELVDFHCPLRLLSASLGSSVRLWHCQARVETLS